MEWYKAGKVRHHKKGFGTCEHKYQKGDKCIRIGKFHLPLPHPAPLPTYPLFPEEKAQAVSPSKCDQNSTQI